MRERRATPPKYLPSLEEIARLCREIRKGWSEEEELRRRKKGRRMRYEFPRIFADPNRPNVVRLIASQFIGEE